MDTRSLHIVVMFSSLFIVHTQYAATLPMFVYAHAKPQYVSRVVTSALGFPLLGVPRYGPHS